MSPAEQAALDADIVEAVKLKLDTEIGQAEREAAASRSIAGHVPALAPRWEYLARENDELARRWRQLLRAIEDGLFVQLDAEDAAGDLERRGADDRPAREILAELSSAVFAVAPGGVR